MTVPFRWGILGCAAIARTFIDAVKSVPDASVAAIASRDARKSESWAAEFGIPLRFGSYDALLSCGELDAVYIPLPNSLHAEWTMRALDAGLPVLCEKPFALNAAQAAQVAEAAKARGLPLAEAFMYRFHPVYRRIREHLDKNALGRLTTIFAQFTFALDDEASISASAELGGGALMDVGCYCVNVARLVAGTEPLRAFALAHMDRVDRSMTGCLEFPDGLLAHFETSIENFERHRLEIAGTDGAITLERPWFPGEKEAAFTLKKPSCEWSMSVEGANGYVEEIKDFMAAVRKEAPLRWPIRDAVANQAVLDALFASLKEGRAMPVRMPELTS